MVLLTWPGGAHFLLRLLLHPVTRASCEKNQYFLRMNDWKGLERIGKDWKGLERIGKDWKGLERIGKDWKGLERIGKDWKGGIQ